MAGANQKTLTLTDKEADILEQVLIDTIYAYENDEYKNRAKVLKILDSIQYKLEHAGY